MGIKTKVIGKPSVITSEETNKRSIIMRLADAIECYRKPAGESGAVSVLRKEKSLTIGFASMLHCISKLYPEVADMNLTGEEMATLLTGAMIEVEIENHKAGEKYTDEDGVEATYQYNCSTKDISAMKFKAGIIDEIETERKSMATFNSKASAIFTASKNSGYDKNVVFSL